MANPKTATASSPPQPPNADRGASSPARRRGRQAALVVLFGDDMGRKIELSETPLTLGSSPECDIRISARFGGDKPSRATVWLDDETVRLEAAGLDDAVFVNDKPVLRAELVHGDRLQVRRAIFKCIVGENLFHEYHKAIYELSTVDPFTGLFNKRFFSEMLKREVERARRYREPLCVAMLDVDFLKRVNDVYGQLGGDRVLTSLAKLARDWGREGDLVARYGGEEFAILLPKHDLEAASDRLGALLRQIESAEISFEGSDLRVTASIGLAVLDPQDDLDTLLERVDRRLGAAKTSGRNRLVYR